MTTILVTAATGDTGRPTVERLLEKRFRVRALVRKDDERAQKLRILGAEIVLGDMASLGDIRAAMAGVQRAYFCYPLDEGLVEAAVIFAQAAKEANVELIANMSHKQSLRSPAARPPRTTGCPSNCSIGQASRPHTFDSLSSRNGFSTLRRWFAAVAM